MKERAFKSGMTLVEVMISVFLVAIAAVIIYTEMVVSYRILMRSRAKLEAQDLAFDELWEIYSLTLPELENYSTSVVQVVSTPAQSILSTNGYIKRTIRPDNSMAGSPGMIQYWDISVKIWPGLGSPLQVGTNAMASYNIRRYRGER